MSEKRLRERRWRQRQGVFDEKELELAKKLSLQTFKQETDGQVSKQEGDCPIPKRRSRSVKALDNASTEQEDESQSRPKAMQKRLKDDERAAIRQETQPEEGALDEMPADWSEGKYERNKRKQRQACYVRRRSKRRKKQDHNPPVPPVPELVHCLSGENENTMPKDCSSPQDGEEQSVAENRSECKAHPNSSAHIRLEKREKREDENPPVSQDAKPGKCARDEKRDVEMLRQCQNGKKPEDSPVLDLEKNEYGEHEVCASKPRLERWEKQEEENAPFPLGCEGNIKAKTCMTVEDLKEQIVIEEPVEVVEVSVSGNEKVQRTTASTIAGISRRTDLKDGNSLERPDEGNSAQCDPQSKNVVSVLDVVVRSNVAVDDGRTTLDGSGDHPKSLTAENGSLEDQSNKGGLGGRKTRKCSLASSEKRKSIGKKKRRRDIVRSHFGLKESVKAGESFERIHLVIDDDLDDFCKLPLHSVVNGSAKDRIAFPSRNDPDAVEVGETDLQCLSESEYLNDTVIDFYIKHMQISKLTEALPQFHVFNSFFFTKLAEAVCVEEKMGKLRKWMRGVNIFEKTYLIMPIHDKMHWSLAIICFLERNSDDTYEPYCILHLDSMRTGHNSRIVYEVLRRYLSAEWKSHHNGDGIKSAKKNFYVRKVKVPQQNNGYDCGLFLLHFMEQFVANAPTKFELEVVKDMFNWFKATEASELRIIIRQLIEKVLKAEGRTLPSTKPEQIDVQEIHNLARSEQSGTPQNDSCGAERPMKVFSRRKRKL